VSISIAVDVPNTFAVTVFMGCEPKTDFNTGEIQRVKRDPSKIKWAVSIAAQTVPLDGQRARPETMSVTIPAESDPAEGLVPGTPVDLIGLRQGSMDPELEDGKVRGGKPFWSATGIRAKAFAKS
jgi:hypothetical protein